MIGDSSVRWPARIRIGLLVPATLLVIVGVLALAHSGRSASFSVGLIAKEYAFDPKDLSAGTGEIAFFVKNQGVIEHNLVLSTSNGKTVTLISVIEPGQTMKVIVSLPPGVYPLYCSLPGHKDAGMVSTLRVSP